MGALFIEMSKYIMKKEVIDQYDDVVTLYRTDSFNSLTTKEEHFKNYGDSFVNGNDFENIFLRDNIRLFEYFYKEDDRQVYMNILNSGERILLGHIESTEGKLDHKTKEYRYEILLDDKGNAKSREFKIHNRDYVIDKILN